MSFNRNCSATRLCFNECKVGAYAFNAVKIRTVAGVNFNHLAFVDEQRNTDFNTGFKLSGLRRVSSGVAFQAGFGVNNLELSLNGHFGEEDGFGRSIANYFANVAFFHEVNTGDEFAFDHYIVPSFLVEEVELVAFSVRELEGTTLNAYVFESFANVETTFEYTTAYNVLQRRTHDGVTYRALHEENQCNNHNKRIACSDRF